MRGSGGLELGRVRFVFWSGVDFEGRLGGGDKDGKVELEVSIEEEDECNFR